MPESLPHSELVERVRAGLPFGSINDPNDSNGAYAALSELEEQLEAHRNALDSIVNARSYVNAGGYVVTGDEAQELAIKRAGDLLFQARD